MPTLTDIFNYIYTNNRWKSAESRSGRGSTMLHTTNIRSWLPKLIEDKKIRSVLDVGCGDLNWMSKIELKVPYMGVDIVPELVKINIDKYGSFFPPTKLFAVADATKDKLPNADLVICRDVLYHLSFVNIKKVIVNIAKVDCRYILLTNCVPVPENVDVKDGGYRRINFLEAPINLPSPTEHFVDVETANEEMILFDVKTLRGWTPT